MLTRPITRPLTRPITRPMVRQSSVYPPLFADFRQQDFRLSGTPVNYDDMFTLSAPSPKWVWNAQGQRVEIPAGQPAFGYDRFTGEPLGQIIESVDATNVLLNSFVPATQTVSVSDATTYTLSVYGSGSAEITAGGSGTATDGSPLTFTTTGTSVTVTVTGTLEVFQLEAGSVATSPIETAGSAVTRAADVLDGNTAFANNYSPNGLAIDFEVSLSRRWIDRNAHVFIASDGTNSNRIIVQQPIASGALAFFVVVEGSVVAQGQTGNLPIGEALSCTLSVKNGASYLSVNGVAHQDNQPTVVLPQTITRFDIGRKFDGSNAGDYVFGEIMVSGKFRELAS